MKKSILTLNSILIGLLLFTSCNDDEIDKVAREIKLSTNEVILKVGAKQEIKIIDGNGTYKVTSSDEDIQVDNTESIITITGKSAVKGEVFVTDSQNKNATIKVTIFDKLSIDTTDVKLELTEGDTNPVISLVTVSGDIDNTNVKSTNTKVADAKKVKNSDGVWNIEITAKGEGTCNIEVTDGDTTEIIKVNITLIKKKPIKIKVYDNSISAYVDVVDEYIVYNFQYVPNFKLENLKNYTLSFDKNNEYKAIIDENEDLIMFEEHEDNTTQDVVVTITEKSNPENKTQFTLKRTPLIVEFSKDGTKIELTPVDDDDIFGKISIKTGDTITVTVSGQKGEYTVESYGDNNGGTFTYEGTSINDDDETIAKDGISFTFTTTTADNYSFDIMDTKTEVMKFFTIVVAD